MCYIEQKQGSYLMNRDELLFRCVKVLRGIGDGIQDDYPEDCTALLDLIEELFVFVLNAGA